jgi:hypothetical protein
VKGRPCGGADPLPSTPSRLGLPNPKGVRGLSFSCPRARCPVGDSWLVCWVCAGFLVDEQKLCMTVFAQADGFVAPRLVAVPARPRASDGRHARRHAGDLRFLRRPRPSSLTRSDLLDAGPKVVCRSSHIPARTPRIRRVTSPTGSSPTRARAGATTVPHSATRADVERVLVELRPWIEMQRQRRLPRQTAQHVPRRVRSGPGRGCTQRSTGAASSTARNASSRASARS